jgi:microcystin-dependent protein
MSSYYYNNHVVSAPPGIIEPYIGGGTTTSGTNPGDPDGWVICDGLQRTVADGRFANLAAILNTYMGVSTNTSNSITPPDLRGQFLRGCDSVATTTKGSGGSNTATLTTAHLPLHTHTVNIYDPGHSHFVRLYAVNDKNFSNRLGERPAADSGAGSRTYNTDNRATGITAGMYNTGDGASFSILPNYVTMNYIMKY